MLQQLMTQWHHDFKRANGYSELEISQKRSAIEHTLRPDSLENHLTRLHDIGFTHVTPCFQNLNFGAMLAIKAA